MFEVKSPFGRYKGRWENNIKADLKEIGLQFLGWIFLAQGQVADTCEQGNESLGSINLRETS